MVERQDIDALLISALYGELTPSEETRLAAHLDSHPADRTALADLTHARGLVRESRLLQVQLEPPASVSTLLMNEAKRCAPKPQPEGWFARFVRSFAAHPAMAAAAMLVVVLGVATLAVNRKADFADSTAPAAGELAGQETISASDPAAPGMATPMGGVAGSGSAMVVLEDDARDQYRVALDEGAGRDFSEQKAKEGAKEKRESKDGSLAFGASSKEQVTKKAAKPTPQGIELRAPAQPAPKDFEDDDATRRKGGKNFESAVVSDKLSDSGDGVASESAPRGEVSTGAASGGGGRSMAPGTASTTTADSSRPTSPRATAPPPPRADSPPPPKTVLRNPPARAAGPADSKPSDPQLAWARDQHAALIAQVRAGDCKKAATIATSISNRAPAYYQQNVETDRAVKACVVYINNERERDAEQRSERARANQKRSINEPAKAAPSKPTTTDTTK